MNLQVEIPEPPPPNPPLLSLAQYAKLPNHLYKFSELAEVQCTKTDETIHYQWVGDELFPVAVSMELLGYPAFKFPDEWGMVPISRNEQLSVVYFRREITP